MVTAISAVRDTGRAQQSTNINRKERIEQIISIISVNKPNQAVLKNEKRQIFLKLA